MDLLQFVLMLVLPHPIGEPAIRVGNALIVPLAHSLRSERNDDGRCGGKDAGDADHAHRHDWLWVRGEEANDRCGKSRSSGHCRQGYGYVIVGVHIGIISPEIVCQICVAHIVVYF